MSKDKESSQQDTLGSDNIKGVDKEPSAKRDTKDEELEEGLEESFPGSDAPASTRRSSEKR